MIMMLRSWNEDLNLFIFYRKTANYLLECQDEFPWECSQATDKSVYGWSYNSITQKQNPLIKVVKIETRF